MGFLKKKFFLNKYFWNKTAVQAYSSLIKSCTQKKIIKIPQTKILRIGKIFIFDVFWQYYVHSYFPISIGFLRSNFDFIGEQMLNSSEQTWTNRKRYPYPYPGYFVGLSTSWTQKYENSKKEYLFDSYCIIKITINLLIHDTSLNRKIVLTLNRKIFFLFKIVSFLFDFDTFL